MNLIKSNKSNKAFMVEMMLSDGDLCSFHGHWVNDSCKFLIIEEFGVLQVSLSDFSAYVTKTIPNGDLHQEISWRPM